MIRIPEAPRPPLSTPGDVLEGTITAAEQGRDSYGNDVLRITVQTQSGPTAYTCNKRLWRLLGGRELGRIRIRREEDSPAVGTMSPAKNFSVEELPEPTSIPAAPPVPQKATAIAW